MGVGDRPAAYLRRFVIWRQWLGRAYDINSVAALPGRYDRQTDFGRLDPYPMRDRSKP